MTIDFDDFGCSHEISSQCQSHDCRDALEGLKKVNPAFKATLFAIPGEMTKELLLWAQANAGWIELAVHGFFHSSNYECEKMGYGEFNRMMELFEPMLSQYFVKGFKAPGWMIGDQAYRWLQGHKWWVADQEYNTGRRPVEMPAYVNDNGRFYVPARPFNERSGSLNTIPQRNVDGHHYHTWNCVNNGIYERYDELKDLVEKNYDFQFVSTEVIGL